MKKLPKFRARSRGPLTEREHKTCKARLNTLYGEMEKLLSHTGHILRGRLQRYRGVDCPCVYVFYDKRAFDDEQRGLMYFLQDLKESGFEIVFREWRKNAPIPDDQWVLLNNVKHDDRYEVCSANNWKWRAFQVRSNEDFSQAHSLVIDAKGCFESVFSEALSARE